jgi:hypothetical protein
MRDHPRVGDKGKIFVADFLRALAATGHGYGPNVVDHGAGISSDETGDGIFDLAMLLFRHALFIVHRFDLVGDRYDVVEPVAFLIRPATLFIASGNDEMAMGHERLSMMVNGAVAYTR